MQVGAGGGEASLERVVQSLMAQDRKEAAPFCSWWEPREGAVGAQAAARSGCSRLHRPLHQPGRGNGQEAAMQEGWFKSRAHRKEVAWRFTAKETPVLKATLFFFFLA